jgi:hypothetical protein
VNWSRLLRVVTVLTALSGLVHLLAPERLLTTAEWGYDRILAVEFQPRENATRRVRLLGLLALAVAVAVERLRRRIVADTTDTAASVVDETD